MDSPISIGRANRTKDIAILINFLRKLSKMLTGFALIFIIILGSGGNLPLQKHLTVPPATSPVDSFMYESWDVQMLLKETPEGKVNAEITETITPVFPDYDQNRGIVRQLPDNYRGAPMMTGNISVKDIEGNDYPYFLTEGGNNPMINVGTDDFLHGKHTFVISYTLNDVVSELGEIYWNMIDEHHAQPVLAFSSSITLDGTLKDRLTGEHSCYIGVKGSTDTCSATLDTEAGTLTQLATELKPREVITLAAGMNIDGLKMPDRSPEGSKLSLIDQSRVSKPTLYFTILGMLLLIVAAFVGALSGRRRSAKNGTVIPEYSTTLSPIEVAVLEGSEQAERRFKHAALMQLAVNKAILIQNTGEKSPKINLLLNDLRYAELLPKTDRELLKSMFELTPDGDGDIGNRTSISLTTDTRLSQILDRAKDKAEDTIVEVGLAKKRPNVASRAIAYSGIAITLLTFIGIMNSSTAPNVSVTASIIIAAVGLFSSFSYLISNGSIFRTLIDLNENGENIHRHALGLKMFIEVAEEDRLKALQSFKGAEMDSKQIFNLYEKLLPFAIIFGQEKSWIENLQILAESTPELEDYALRHSPFMNLRNDEYKALQAGPKPPPSSSSSGGGSSSGSSGGGSSGGGGGGGYSGGR